MAWFLKYSPLSLQRFMFKWLVLPKLVYLFVTFSAGLVIPYFPLFFKQFGDSDPLEIGILMALMTVVGIVASPFWTGLADKYQIHRAILLASYFAFIGVIFCMPLIGDSFVMLITLIALVSGFQSGLLPMIEAFCLQSLPNPGSYGRQRLWGAAGWGLGSLISGIFATESTLPYIFMFDGAVGMFAALIVSMSVCESTKSQKEEMKRLCQAFPDLDDSPPSSPEEPIGSINDSEPLINNQETLQQSGRRSPIKLLLSNFPVLAFLIVAVEFGSIMTVLGNFLGLYLIDIGYPDNIVGITTACTVVLEFPIFFFSDFFLEKLGRRMMIVIAHIVYLIRLVGDPLVSYYFGGYYFLIFESLHGIAFGFFWSASISYIQVVTPKGLEATAQGLIFGAMRGLGSSLGALVGGTIFQFAPNPADTFYFFAIVSAVGCVFFVLTYKEPKKIQLPQSVRVGKTSL